MIFNEQIRLYGNHAKILKKYSKDKGGDNSVQYLLEDGTPVYIFDNMFKCFMVAAMWGISNCRKGEIDRSDNIDATMFLDIINKNRKNVERICQHMILSKKELSVDERIKKAFAIERSPEEEKEIEHEIILYALGGLELIDELFDGCETYDSISNKLWSLNSLLHIGKDE